MAIIRHGTVRRTKMSDAIYKYVMAIPHILLGAHQEKELETWR